MNVACPVCSAETFPVRELSKETIVQSLEHLFQKDEIRGCGFGDYELRRCLSCELEFANPMAEPGSDFYLLLSELESGYVKERWEWLEWRRQIENIQPVVTNSLTRVLDVGCGSGNFLQLVRQIPFCKGYGIDISDSSVRICVSQGVEALQGDITLAKSIFRGNVDIVTMWHVIEHVADPIDYLLQAKELLAENGKIFFSVPLSPLSYEISWSDPLNLPPHHLTRWNLKSIKALAEKVGMSLKISMPESDPLTIRIFRSLLLQAVSPFVPHSRIEKLLKLSFFILKNPWQSFLSAYRQTGRERLNGKTLPDVVLGQLSLLS